MRLQPVCNTLPTKRIPVEVQAYIPFSQYFLNRDIKAAIAYIREHEAQHTVDMKQFPGITPPELEYRAKLVELHYANDLELLQKFLTEADDSKTSDSHAVAFARIKYEFADIEQRILLCIKTRALELLHTDIKEISKRVLLSRKRDSVCSLCEERKGRSDKHT